MNGILNCNKDDLASYIKESFDIICEYLDINTELIISSELDKNCELKGQHKVLSICSLLGATEYYNAIGGQELYSFEAFKEQGIKLSFLKTEEIIYKQFNNEFCPNLSLIDVLMFNSKEKIKEMLNKFSLITE